MFCNIDFTRAASQVFSPAVCYVGKVIILEIPICGAMWIPNRIINSSVTASVTVWSKMLTASVTPGCCFLWVCRELSLSGSDCYSACWQGALGPGTAERCGRLRVSVFYCETSAALVSVAKAAPLHLGSRLRFFYSPSASRGQLHLLGSRSPLPFCRAMWTASYQLGETMGAKGLLSSGFLASAHKSRRNLLLPPTATSWKQTGFLGLADWKNPVWCRRLVTVFSINGQI